MPAWSDLMRKSLVPLRAAGSFAVDVVYPKRCAGCGRRGSWLCPACDERLARFGPPWCSRCGVPHILESCRCDSMPELLKAARSVGPFDGWLRGAISQLKYHGEWGRANGLGPLVAAVIDDLSPCDGLVPVPLHHARLKHRGFNQSLLVAREAAVILNVPVFDLLQRTRRTSPQVHLGAIQRQINVRGAFVVSPGARVRGMNLVLIDDVITTGSTLAACAGPLIEAGAATVSVATIAREL